MDKRKKYILCFWVILFLSLLYILFWRWQVSAFRFFDADEFSYMHWTAQVARGEHIYTDFFSYFTPGFMWIFAPIFWIYGISSQVLSAGRSVSFVIFLGILGALGYLFGITRGWRWAILPVVILAFLPMPYDKFLEIRPDNLATLLAVIGIIIEVLALQEKKNSLWLISGLTYSASLLVLEKTLPIVSVGGGIAVIFAWHDRKKMYYFLSGLFAPWIVFFLGVAIFSKFGVVWYSLTKLPFEVYKSAANDYWGPDLFFHPNAAFYGGTNFIITPGLIVNHAIWISALLVGTYRLVTPALAGSRHRVFTEFLLAGVFIVSVVAYVKYFPMKHSQYLIPIAVFIAYYAADGLSSFFNWLAKTGGYASLAILLIGFAYILITVTKDVNAPKVLKTNAAQLSEFNALIRTVPLRARVVDLDGRMFFWPDGYPISSIPFDSFLSYVSRAPLPLAQYLTYYPADYIYGIDRLNGLSQANVDYIRTHFVSVAGFNNRLWKKL